jgi:hypothetical protein
LKISSRYYFNTKLEPQDIKLKADPDGDRRLEDKNIGGSQKDETKGNLKGLRGKKQIPTSWPTLPLPFFLLTS